METMETATSTPIASMAGALDKTNDGDAILILIIQVEPVLVLCRYKDYQSTATPIKKKEQRQTNPNQPDSDRTIEQKETLYS